MVDALCVLRSWHELHVCGVVDVVDDGVVPSDVEQLLLVDHEETVVDLSITSEKKFGRYSDTLHA